MGFFSWMTQDTGRSIANVHSSQPTFTVYMGDQSGNYWVENAYDGYGKFGGKDYYELLAEMNMVVSKYHTRDVGIDLEFSPSQVEGERKQEQIIFPSLTEYKPRTTDYYINDKPKSCPDQGFFYAYDEFYEEDYDSCGWCDDEC